ncbi:RNA-binding cell elongation regulator Jag/EloR [Chloroflexota bacterium]
MEARKKERRSVVASGKTVDDAIDIGLAMLGVRRGQVDVEVLSQGSRGVLGFGAENARVQLSVKPPPEPPPPAPAPKPPPPPAAPEPGPIEPKPETQQVEAAEPASDEPTAEQIGQVLLTDILKRMGISASVESSPGYELAEEGQEPPVVLNITGDDLGILIGRRGETLRALQYLIRLMISHRLKHWTDLVVDVEHYRVRRRRTLENLAQRVAERVAREGRAQALEPMPAYDRRLVHIALRKNPQVTTRSVGEGERRKVTIIPKQ